MKRDTTCAYDAIRLNARDAALVVSERIDETYIVEVQAWRAASVSGVTGNARTAWRKARPHAPFGVDGVATMKTTYEATRWNGDTTYDAVYLHTHVANRVLNDSVDEGVRREVRAYLYRTEQTPREMSRRIHRKIAALP